ncbi:AbrB/MazE/SpoVT family DNA-binding domain-containing protein [Candidatus Poribacteria bacterium]|nr:AbrB/MazE/SpoVT family DNA-binding domain-containing protein [Candidatus Poribacteria bacterium]
MPTLFEYTATYKQGNLTCPKEVAQKLGLKTNTEVKVILMRDLDTRKKAQAMIAHAKLKAIELAKDMTEEEVWTFYAKATEQVYQEYKVMREQADVQRQTSESH